MKKDRILACFKAVKGDWVSGEALSRELNISRTAVWKHISRLREEGYRIESSPKKGYLLEADTTRLLPFEVRNHLETTLLGRREIVHFLETDSTNARAKDLAEKGAGEGTLVIAEAQTAGRGRKGRNWFSPPFENLYISLILRPDISPADAPRMTLLCAVAAAQTLVDLTARDVAIKWPNDVLMNGKKVAGILTELSAEQDRINYMAVGLGFNVNTKDFPPDIEEKATSIFREIGRTFPRVRLLCEYLKRVEFYYGLCQKSGFGPILDEWRALSCLRQGKRVRVSFLKDRVEGVVEDIDENGALIVMDDQGIRRRLFSGDVEPVL